MENRHRRCRLVGRCFWSKEKCVIGLLHKDKEIAALERCRVLFFSQPAEASFASHAEPSADICRRPETKRRRFKIKILYVKNVLLRIYLCLSLSQLDGCYSPLLLPPSIKRVHSLLFLMKDAFFFSKISFHLVYFFLFQFCPPCASLQPALSSPPTLSIFLHQPPSLTHSQFSSVKDTGF